MVLWTVIIEKTPGVLVKGMRGRGKGMDFETLQKPVPLVRGRGFGGYGYGYGLLYPGVTPAHHYVGGPWLDGGTKVQSRVRLVGWVVQALTGISITVTRSSTCDGLMKVCSQLVWCLNSWEKMRLHACRGGLPLVLGGVPSKSYIQ